MPATNSRKTYAENSYYHLYNRGVEKRTIFQDKQDYSVFLSYLKTYLLPKDEDILQEKLANKNTEWKEKDKIIKQLRLNNFNQELFMLAYCLMPNHFHFLVKQKNPNSIDKFINSLNTRYVMYFNKKYKRVGPLFQGVYKAVLVTSDSQLLHLSAYIHRNPIRKKNSISQGEALQRLSSQPSSFQEYLGERKTDWIKPETILRFFSKTNKELSYQSYVVHNLFPKEDISELILD